MKLVFATHNVGKIREVGEILTGLEVQILSAEEAGVTEDVVEDGKTFEENALKKARFVAGRLSRRSSDEGGWVMADDSGICVEALGGAPGVNSARWAPRNELAEYTLEKIKDIPEDRRGACFECAIALVAPDSRHWFFVGRVEGFITEDLRGKSHPKLPYDSIFIPNGHNKTFAEMSAEEKNRISHRGLAFRKLREFLSLTIDPALREGRG